MIISPALRIKSSHKRLKIIAIKPKQRKVLASPLGSFVIALKNIILKRIKRSLRLYSVFREDYTRTIDYCAQKRTSKKDREDMRAEIIVIGSELLLGESIDTNGPWIAEHLRQIGIDCHFKAVVGDNLDNIANTFTLALSRADIVLSTGG